MNFRYECARLGQGDYHELQELFETAFPPEERPPFEMAVSWENSNFCSVFDGNQFVGLRDVIAYQDIVYLFFLAVKKEFRGKGVGTKILQDFKSTYEGKRLFMLVDELSPEYEDYEVRKNRYAFYQKNGFRPSGTIVHEFGVAYEIFTGEGYSVSKEEFVAVMTYLIGEKMAAIYYKDV